MDPRAIYHVHLGKLLKKEKRLKIKKFFGLATQDDLDQLKKEINETMNKLSCMPFGRPDWETILTSKKSSNENEEKN